MQELASVDGAIGPLADARIPVCDAGLTRGDGAFEVARVYAGTPLALPAHMARLARTAAGLRLPYDAGVLADEIGALLAAAGPVDAMLRIVLTRGGRRLALLEALPSPPTLVRLATVTYAPNRVLDGLKTLSYGGNMLATRLAQEAGADDALLVSPHGRVLEAPRSAFFWVSGGELLTPPLSDGILASITRSLLIEETGAREARCTREDLAGAEEAFLASTVREVLPIAAIDERSLPAVPGPVSRDAAVRLRARIERELA